MATIDKDFILDAQQVADILKCSKPTALRLFDMPDFPGFRIGDSKRALRRVSKQAFFEWLNHHHKKKEGT